MKNAFLKSIWVFSILPILVYGQEKKQKTENYFIWASYGACISYTDNLSSIPGLRVSVDAAIYQKVFFEFQYAGHQRQEHFFEDPPANRLINLYNKSMLVGYGKYVSYQLAIIGYAGVSWGSGVYRGNYHMEKNPSYAPSFSGFGFSPQEIRVYEKSIFHYTGIPFNLKFLWTGLYSGFGLDLYYNHHEHAEYGIILSGNLGKIRNPKLKKY